MTPDAYEQSSYLENSQPQGPVECLGLTFDNDAARQSYFLEILRQKLQKPEFSQTAGFPNTSELDNILAISDPPYYTVCPNPFLKEILDDWGNQVSQDDAYRREPFSADISMGKNDPLYEAFSYHTKVPHKAIQAYIEHYCPTDGVVLDGFCGSGMTGLAGRLSHRRVVLFDLSPAATSVAASYTMPVSQSELTTATHKLIKTLKEQCAWLYETVVPGKLLPATLDYMIWSEQYRCPNCQAEFLFSDIGFDFEASRPKSKMNCPVCDVQLNTDQLERCLDHSGRTIEKPVRVKYVSRRRTPELSPSTHDLEILETIDAQEIPFAFPDNWMMNVTPSEKGWGDMWRRGYHSGIWKVSDFFYKRTQWCLAVALDIVNKQNMPPAVRTILRASIVNAAASMTRMRRAYQGVLPLVLYMPRMRREVNVIRALETRFERLDELLGPLPAVKSVAVSTQSSTDLSNLPADCVDYIFTDPPFGDNIIYSEVNFIWESLLRVFTTQSPEAIMSRRQKKGLLEYQELMTACFKEFHRVLKPGRWMTVEFHNSQNSVWNAIQAALQIVGFVVADVRILDKQQGSFKQVSTAGAVKQDLVISAYKPSERLEQEFSLYAGKEAAVWEFVREHLSRLPILVEKNGQIEVVAERQNYLLFDRMVAFHIRHRVTIPLSANEFYAGLIQRFPERDGMFFLPEQVGHYDQRRIAVGEVTQLTLFVNDEASAILWLRQQLNGHPQTYQDLFPKFLKELSAWQKHEKALELSEILEQNFLRYDGQGPLPAQIFQWIQEQPDKYDGENANAPSPTLRAAVRDRWYVPDPNQVQDLEKMREKLLLQEFEAYQTLPDRLLKVVRTESVRAGFKKAWQEKKYQTIIDVARKLPESTLEEDSKLMMWYDQARTRIGHDSE